jgi:hypothetical protein
MALVQVVALVEDTAKVEIETTAVLSSGKWRPSPICGNIGHAGDLRTHCDFLKS